tara:strand:- start:30 stop:332 length:303 start_codon:yes stop_codon:yes gene_type:complete
VDKTTIRLIRFTCIFIIFGGIFGALWRVIYVKNIEREKKEKYMNALESESYLMFMEMCSQNKLFYNEIENVDEIMPACEEEYKNKYLKPIPTDKKLKSDF